MVTDVEQATQTDLVPDHEAQTQSAPEVTFPDAAADPVEEAAAPVEAEAPAEEAEKPLTRAEIEAMLKERETVAEQRATEKLRRERQRDEGRRVAEVTRQAQEKAEIAEVMGLELYKLGIPDASPESITPILERYASKREGHVTNRTLDDVAKAFEYAAADVLGLDSEVELSPKAEEYARSLAPFVESVKARAIEGLTSNGDYIAKAELSKYVDAEIERRNAKNRETKQPLVRMEGASSTRDDTMDARVQRIISGTADKADEEWWNSRFGRK